MRILLVEDDPALQASLAEILREAGYAVDVTGMVLRVCFSVKNTRWTLPLSILVYRGCRVWS